MINIIQFYCLFGIDRDRLFISIYRTIEINNSDDILVLFVDIFKMKIILEI